MINPSKKSLRSMLRAQRRGLSKPAQTQASKNLSKQLLSCLKRNTLYQRKQTIHVGCYLAGDGEINPKKPTQKIFKKKTQLLYPIIEKNKTLTFGLKQRGFFRTNRFGILEPQWRKRRPLKHLDIVLLPLVAATTKGARLGMGGGFYDRTLAHQRPWKKGPILIGLAHDFQIQKSIHLEPFDQPLDFVVTDKRWYHATREARRKTDT